MDRSGHVDPGFPMDSAWRGALPPDTGFAHIDDVPARVVLDLAQRGVALAKEHGSAHGPPVSLLDQEVVAVSSAARRRRHPDALRIRLDRNGFPAAVVGAAEQGKGLDPGTVAADEIVRVRALPAWLRIDARFGSVYRRRGDPAWCCARLPSRACGECTALAACRVRHARSRKNYTSQAAVFGGSLPSTNSPLANNTSPSGRTIGLGARVQRAHQSAARRRNARPSSGASSHSMAVPSNSVRACAQFGSPRR